MNTPPSDVATPVVSDFYDRFPYPADPLQDGPPPGYNWRWCHNSVLAAVRGGLKAQDSNSGSIRILDAGCGTGVSTDYLCHLNAGAEILAVDISAGALDVARERLRRSGGADQVGSLRQEQRSLLDLQEEGRFDYINSVGVLHHLRDPLAGLKALGQQLAPQGLLHLFLYADAGRWEIHRTQRALEFLEAGTGANGLKLGRELFSDLPETNRLRRTHEQRWALDTHADANFADMYLHPQETSYDLERLMALIKSSGLCFAGFSNPSVWDPARLLKGELLSRAQALPLSDQWALVEQLDPDISHFEFFVSAQPIQPLLWDNDETMLQASGRRQPCLWGWPSKSMLGPDFEPISISEEELNLLRLVDENPEVPLGILVGPRNSLSGERSHEQKIAFAGGRLWGLCPKRVIDSARFLRRCLQAPTSTDLDGATAPTDSGMEGYARLQRRLMLVTLVISLCAALFAYLRFDLLVARSLLVGSCAGLLYLRLLARSVARLGGGSRQVGRFQIVVPVLLVVAAAKLPQLELLPAFLGFLLYKPALILQTVIDG